MNYDRPWYKLDKLGWPIETFKGKPIKSFLRIIIQNFRKLFSDNDLHPKVSKGGVNNYPTIPRPPKSQS